MVHMHSMTLYAYRFILNAVLFSTIQSQFCMPNVRYVAQEVNFFNFPSVNPLTKLHLGSCVNFCFNEKDGDVVFFETSNGLCFCLTFQSETVFHLKHHNNARSLEVIFRILPDQSKYWMLIVKKIY